MQTEKPLSPARPRHGIRPWTAIVLATVFVSLGVVRAQVLPPQNPSQFDVTGFIQAASLDSTCAADPLCGGTITVNNQVITIPKNTILQMPAAALTWQQLFVQAPAPYGVTTNPPSTGLAMSDNPTPLATYEAHVVGNRVKDAGGNDRYIAGLVFLAQHSLQSGQGFINFIDYATGEFYVGGTTNDATTGARVKINDPLGKFGRAWSPDVRFTIDENNPTIRSETGYPMCVPRVAPGARGAAETDPQCPQANRPLDPTSPSGIAMILTMPAPAQVVAGSPDPRKMAPFEVGDYVTYSGILLNDAAGHYIGAFAAIGNVGLFTAPGSNPAYVALDVMLLGVGGQTVAGAAEATARTRFEGFTTDPSRNILLFGVDVDACTGADGGRSWGSSAVDQGPPVGAVRGRWRFRPPNGITTGPAAGTFLPPTREMRAAIETVAGSGIPVAPSVDANGNVLPGSGVYQAPIFEFLFPENAGVGTPIVPNNFEDFPFLVNGSGPLNGTGPVVSQLSPWPLGFTPPAAAPVCQVAGGPIANAGPDQTVSSGSAVTLVGSGSDPNGLAVTFAWSQVGGTPVALTGASTSTLSFTAPILPFGSPAALLTFQLIVTNAAGVASAPDTVVVTVNPAATDTVAITLVEYRTSKFRLTVDATTTATGRIPAPVLTMQAYDKNGVAQGSPVQMPFIGGGIYEVILVGAAQPATVRVTSSYGGSATSGLTRLRQ